MWDDLKTIHAEIGARRIADLFENADRLSTFSVEVDDLYFDFSKTNIDDDTLDALVELAQKTNVEAMRDQMFSGAKINLTENRAVLHTALRNLSGKPVFCDGQDVMPEILETRQRMVAFAKKVRANPDIENVINIGIGGSDLGPAMATIALSPYADGPATHFVSNVDSADLADTIEKLDPKKTLVIVASKTFTTQETMMNALSAREWMVQGGGDPAAQFAAISTAAELTAEFGVAPENVFGFEDWVGGRYSMWGPIGLSLMIAVGPENFDAFLEGGFAMDRHFQTAPLERNLPALLALVGIWHHQLCGHGTRAVLPYENRLSRLPAYLQQLEMESNGKGVTRAGDPLTLPSGPVVWGEPGTNGQHAFYQLIHQGTAVIPCEFMIGQESHEPELAQHHMALQANCLAQSEALLRGRTYDESRAQLENKGVTGGELDLLAKHRVFPGNRPSTTLVYPKLTPYVLGQIIALYEHRVFVEGIILDINSFDQWGVELGKELAGNLLPAIQGGENPQDATASTEALLNRLKVDSDV